MKMSDIDVNKYLYPWQVDAITLCLNDVFIYKRRLWQVIEVDNNSEGSYVDAYTLDHDSDQDPKYIRFTYAFNPTVLEITTK